MALKRYCIVYKGLAILDEKAKEFSLRPFGRKETRVSVHEDYMPHMVEKLVMQASSGRLEKNLFLKKAAEMSYEKISYGQFVRLLGSGLDLTLMPVLLKGEYSGFFIITEKVEG